MPCVHSSGAVRLKGRVRSDECLHTKPCEVCTGSRHRAWRYPFGACRRQDDPHRLPEVRHAHPAEDEGAARGEAEAAGLLRSSGRSSRPGRSSSRRSMSAPSISARPAKRRRSSPRPPARRWSMSAYEPPAPEAEAILVPKDSPLKTVADLKGKNVALNKGSNVHYLLVKALEKAGLAYSDIEVSFLPPADARAAFEKGAVDAWVIWEPFLAAAEAATGARQLADGTGVVDNHEFYLASRDLRRHAPRGRRHDPGVARRDRHLDQCQSRRGCRAVLAGARHPDGRPRSRRRAPQLRRQADHARRRGRAAEDRRRLLRARPDPDRNQDRRRREEAAVVNVAADLPPTA